MNKGNQAGVAFGGFWTEKKLEILGRYLDAYTTALKGQEFKLLYVDAFAGGGHIEIPGSRNETHGLFVDIDRADDFLKGSAERAARIDDKPFDELIFVDNSAARCEELCGLKSRHPDRNIKIERSEANDFLRNKLDKEWSKWRGVLFLDPFATEVEWKTIERIAGFEALDTWILFPVSAVTRMLPVGKRPEDISDGLAKRLNKIYGDDSWESLYSTASYTQLDLFGEPNDDGQHRDSGASGLVNIYKDNLKGLYGQRFLRKSKSLFNSNNSRLFEFMFCVGHPKGIDAAKRIAAHILDHI